MWYGDQIHQVTKPVTNGIHAHASVAALHHFRGYNLAGLQTCRQFIRDTDWIPASWARDWDLAKAAKIARLKVS